MMIPLLYGMQKFEVISNQKLNQSYVTLWSDPAFLLEVCWK